MSVIDRLPSGRRRIAVTSKGTPAPDVEHSTGWICHPDDIPVHKCHDCRKPPEPGKSRCKACATKHRDKTAAGYAAIKKAGGRWVR